MNDRAPVNVHDAKTNLSKLLAEVAQGREIVLARAGKPVARLVPIPSTATPPRHAGFLRGRIRLANDFDAQLDADVLAAFEDRR